jgi:5-methylcytosine-specific restriction endonuclease McrA
MFKGYIVVERYEDKIKLLHVATGDQSWRYKANCVSCGIDRGWQKKFKLHLRCNSCAQRENCALDLTLPDNVNSEDTIRVAKNKGSEIRYRCRCGSCNKDRGYIALGSAHKLCRSCVRKQIHNSKNLEEKRAIAQKISNTQTGREVFVGFTTSESDKQRDLFKTKQLSKACFDRDSYTCQICSLSGVELNAHHINSFSLFPEQRFDLNNLITLCSACHKDFHKEFGRGKNTAEQFLQFKNSK